MSWLQNLEMLGEQSIANATDFTQRSPNGVMGGDYDIQAKTAADGGNTVTPYFYQLMMGYDSK